MNRSTIRKIYIFASLFLVIIWSAGLVWNSHGLQSNLFFHDTNDWFMDFFNVVYWSTGRTPYTWGLVECHEYLPIGYLILYPFSFFSEYTPVNDTIDISSYAARYSQLPAISCMAFISFSVCILFYSIYKKSEGSEVEKLGILLALFFSNTNIYNFDRANEITLAIGLLFTFLLTYDSENTTYRQIGYVCLALSAGLKFVPALFGILILFNKRYKEALITILYGLCVAILPFFLLEGSFTTNVKLFIEGIMSHGQSYANSGKFGFSNNTIFYSSFNYIAFLAIGMFILAVIASYFTSGWKKILLLTLAMVLVTEQQAFYCITYLFFPFIMYLNDDNHENFDWLWVIGFIIVFTPLQYNFSLGPLNFMPIYVINTILLIMYIVLIVQGLQTACRLYFSKFKSI